MTSTFRLSVPANLINSAFAGTSFSPERRGQQAVGGFQSELDADFETLERHAEIGGTKEKLEDEFLRYAAGYSKRVLAYLHSSARCVSTMIAGPSNFPVRRMNKRAEIAHSRSVELSEFRHRALKAAIRNLRPDLRPIMAGDADAIDRLEAEIARAERVQAQMKAANATIRAHKKEGTDHQVAALMELSFTEERARELVKGDFCGRIGFPAYALSNNSAEIRRLEERLKKLKEAKAKPVIEKKGENGVTMQDDPPSNRVRLFFPGKPDDETRERLKSNGFRWTPTLGCWQAYRNYRAMLAAKSVLGDEVAA